MTGSFMARFATAFLLLSISLLTACGGCNGGNGNAGEATVSIEAIDPEAGYPGVDMMATFTIEPGEGTNAGGMQWEVDFGDGTRTTGEGVEGDATHAYELAGQYDVEVTALFDGEEVGNAVQPVRVFSPVDLAIAETRGTPANATAGEDLQISFEVTNNTAAEVRTPFEVAAFLSTEPNVTVEDLEDLVALGTSAVEPDAEDEPVIESGGTRSAAFSATIPDDLTGGDYYVVTQLDPRERIADTDLTNNLDVSGSIVRVENLDEALPDVCVRDLFVTPDRAFPQLNSITRGFVLCNNGGQDAFDIVVKTYLSIGDDQFDPGQDRLIDTTEPQDVFAESSVDVGPDQIVLPVGEEIVPDAGDVEVWVAIVAESTDPNATDSDPENNQVIGMQQILVTDEPVMGPDIVVRDFAVSPDSTFLNGTLNMTATIANEGTVDVGTFFCGIYLGGGPRVDTMNDPRLTNVNVPSLDADEEISFDQPITIPGLYDPGVYHLYMVCDPLNALMEPFRSNNAFVYTTPITVTDEADVDMYVESLAVPSDATEGEQFDVTATICVSGTNPSGDTLARLYRNPGTQVDYMADPLAEFDVPNVLPGGDNCIDVDITVDASCQEFQDTYVYGVELDVDDRLPEIDESNNRASGSMPNVVDGEFCQCTEDAFEPNDRPIEAVPLMEGTTEAAICTAGNCDYWGVDLQAGDSLVVQTAFDSTKGALTTTLFDSSGLQSLATDSSDDLQEVSTFLVPQAGRYVARVCGSTAVDRNLYDLDVDILPQSSGVDVLPRDVTLPFGDSFSIGAEVDVSTRIYNLGQQASGAFDAEVYVSPDPVLTDDGNNTLLGSQQISSVSASGIRDVTIPVTLPATLTDGEYWILVVLDPQDTLGDTDTANNRALSRKFAVETECFDPLEPNDSFGAPHDISSGSFSNLTACASADDYYRLCLATGKRFDVTVDFNDAEGDIDLELLNDQAVLIDSSANTGSDVEQVAWDFVNGDQCFYIRSYVVTLDPDLQTTYSMTVNVEDVDPSLLCDSVFEPNDSFANASSFVSAESQTFSVDRCPSSDTDFYFVNLGAGQTVSFTAEKNPPSQAGTLRLQLYQPNMTPGPNEETAPGVPTATIDNYTAPTAGTYFLQVTVTGATRNVTYDLSSTGLGGIDLTPQDLVIGPGDYQVNDEVRFAFDLTNLRSDDATSPAYEVFYGESPSPDPANDISLGTFVAPNVPGNSTVNVDDKADVPGGASDGDRYIHVVVDPMGVSGDLNASNNDATTSITIVP